MYNGHYGAGHGTEQGFSENLGKGLNTAEIFDVFETYISFI